MEKVPQRLPGRPQIVAYFDDSVPYSASAESSGSSRAWLAHVFNRKTSVGSGALDRGKTMPLQRSCRGRNRHLRERGGSVAPRTAEFTGRQSEWGGLELSLYTRPRSDVLPP